MEDERDRRTEILSELLGATGDNVYIEPTFLCDYGENIFIGNNFYANFDCVILDVCKVSIGDNVKFGPRVCVYAAGHPIDAQTRNSLLEFGKSIKLGDNVWIGGSAVILPGVTIGDNTVIGAGAVVTKDIPASVVAAGNPCKVIRKIKT
jgi:maltose O-acetyltransferase